MNACLGHGVDSVAPLVAVLLLTALCVVGVRQLEREEF